MESIENNDLKHFESITKQDLNTSVIKKELGLFRCCQRYHNKNKQGGNFALDLRFNKEFVRGQEMEISGDYAINGQIINLRLSEAFSCGQKIPKEHLKSFEALLSYLKVEIAQTHKLNGFGALK